MGRHAAAITTIDDHRLIGAKPFGHAGRVHGRVAATVDCDSPTDLRRISLVRIAKKTNGIENLAGIPRRNVDLLADMRPDRDEDRIESILLFLGEYIFDTMV